MNQFLLALAMGASLSAYAQAPTQDRLLRHVPPDADQIYHLNSPVLFKEMTWEQLLDAYPVAPTNSGREAFANVRDFVLQAGIDTKQEIIVATTNQSHQDSFRYTTIICHLVDSGKYINFLHQKIRPLRPQPLRSVHAEGSMRAGTAFTNTLGVFIAMVPPQFENPAVPPIPTIEWQMLAARRAAAALRGYEHSFFATDRQFLAEFDNGADLHYYTRSGSNMTVFSSILKFLFGRSEAVDIASSLGRQRPTISSLQVGNRTLTYSSSQPAEPAEMRLAQKPLNEKLLEAIPPGKKILGMAWARIDLADSAAKTIRQGKVHNAYERLTSDGFQLRDAFTGDLLMLCLEPDQATIDSTGNAAPVFVVLGNIGDRSALDKLLVRLDAFRICHAVHDDLVVFGMNHGQVKAFATAVGSGQTFVERASMPTTPVAFLFNLRAFGDFYARIPPANDTVAASQAVLVPLLEQYERFSFATGGIQDGRIGAWLQLTLADPAKSPIITILQMLKNAHKH
jgi:hypothetical protein